MDLIAQSIVDRCREAIAELANVPEEERIDAINRIRLALHEVSPFKHEPVDCVLWIPAERVHANDYNPNTVAPPEMRLLKRSIEADGYTQPIVTHVEGGPERALEGEVEVVDGFHRNRVGREYDTVRERVRGHLPVTVIKPDRSGRTDRIAATIRHNRARGKHGVEAMSEIVMELARRNWSDEKIARELGMDPDEVLRLKQITGLAELFKDREFSRAWEASL